MNGDNFEPMRKHEGKGSDRAVNSGKLKRELNTHAGKVRHKPRPKGIRRSKVPKRLRKLLDGDA